MYKKRNTIEYRLYIKLTEQTTKLFHKAYAATHSENVESLLEIVYDNNEYEVSTSCAILRGLFDAEGSVYWHHGRGIEIKISTSSKSLLALCTKSLGVLGLHYNVTIDRRRDLKHKRDYYYVRLFGSNARTFISKVKPLKLLVSNYLQRRISHEYVEVIKQLYGRKA